MDVILDTNILRTDFFLKSKDFEILFDYIEKTQSELILLNIVLLEIEKIYEEELSEKINNFRRINAELGKLLPENKIEVFEIDIEKQKNKFKKNILEKFRIRKYYNEIVKPPNSTLNRIIKRAVEKKKPFKNNGIGFKDALLWESIVEYVKRRRNGVEIIFISNNVKDFADEENKDFLHPLFVEEIKSFDGKISYFKTIKDFIEQRSKPINQINSEWINQNLENELYQSRIKEAIEIYESRWIIDWFESNNINLKANGIIKVNRIFFGKSSDFYVYEMSKKNWIINFEHEIEAEVEIGFDKKKYFNSFTEGLIELNYTKLNLYVTLEKIDNTIKINDISFDVIS